jgi:hypothetical protein
MILSKHQGLAKLAEVIKVLLPASDPLFLLEDID